MDFERLKKIKEPKYLRVVEHLCRYYGVSERASPEPTKDLNAMAVPGPDPEIVSLREEYREVVGRRPFHGWDADELRQRIETAKGE